MKDLITLSAESFKIKGSGIYEYQGETFEVHAKDGSFYDVSVRGKRYPHWTLSDIKRKLNVPAGKALKLKAEDAVILDDVPADTTKEVIIHGGAADMSGEPKETLSESKKDETVDIDTAEEVQKAEEEARKAEQEAAEAIMRAEEARKEAEEKRKAAEAAAKADGDKVRHPSYDTVKQLVSMDIPVYLYGPAGTGKNVICQQIAKDLGLEFYFANSITQEYKITGYVDAHGRFHETEFYRAFKHGGIMMLDEIDASIPEVLTLLNAATANRYLVFGNNEKVQAHKDFRVVAAGNTAGTGATEEYCGRVQLDAASLNRFAVMELNYAPNIEEKVAGNNNEVLEFCRAIRKAGQDTATSMVVSYRNISMLASMDKVFNADLAVKLAITKGMEADDISTLADAIEVDAKNKFYKALKNMVK